MDRLGLSILFVAFTLLVQTAFAEITVADVRRNIPLSDEEPAYTDYYLNGGESEGLKKNLVVTVFRAVNVRDSSGAQSLGEITVPVAQVKVIAVFPKLAVAREYKVLSRDENPMLEQTGIMAGDKITTKDSFVDSKTKRKPQAIAIAPPTPAPALSAPAPQTAPAASPVAAPVAKPAPTEKPVPVAPSAAAPIPPAPATALAEKAQEEKNEASDDELPAALYENPVNTTDFPPAKADSAVN